MYELVTERNFIAQSIKLDIIKVNRTTAYKCAIYLRISLDRNMDGLAIDRQRQDCLNLAKFRGWEIFNEYVDQSISATDKTKKRPAYDQMVRDYEAGCFDAIVCYDLDRLTRQPRQLEDWIDRAETKGLSLVTANGDADLSTDGGRMYARIKSAVAKAEVERKGARQSRAQEQRAQQGRAPKGVPPYGYDVKAEIVDDEATAVLEIYKAFAAGHAIRAIARALNGDEIIDGIPTLATRKGKAWNPASVQQMLRNPRYAGYSVYTTKKDRQQPAGESRRKALKNNIVRDDDGNPIKGQWEPIVPSALWWEVQSILDNPKRVTNHTGSTKRKYVGAGLYECGCCGAKLITRARYYSCPNGCMNRTRGNIDDFVFAVIAERLKQPDLNRRKKQNIIVDDDLEAAIAKQNERIARAERDYDLEIIEGADLKRIRDNARDEIQKLKADSVRKSTATALLPILRTAQPWQAFLDAEMETKRAVIDTLATVTLMKVKQGQKGFKPESVTIEWR